MGVLLAFGTALSFSVMNLSIRKGGRAYPGENAVLATLVVNIVVFSALLAIAAAVGTLQEPSVAGALAFASIGLTGPFLGRQFLFAGINRIGVVRASAIKNAAPIVTLAMAVVIVGERFAPLGIAGIALILAGMLVVVRESLVGDRVPIPAIGGGEPLAGEGPGGEGRGGDGLGGDGPGRERLQALGVALALLAAVSFGASNALSKVGMNIVPDAIQAGFFAGWAGLAAYLAWEALRGRAGRVPAVLTARRPWFWLAGVAGTAGQLTFFAALHFIAVGPATVIAASEVVLTTALGGLLAQQLEQVTRRIAVPALLVFAGAALIAVSR